jgi:hypothetical protein
MWRWESAADEPRRQKVLKHFSRVHSRTHTKQNETKLTTTNSSGRWPLLVVISFLSHFPHSISFDLILGKNFFEKVVFLGGKIWKATRASTEHDTNLFEKTCHAHASVHHFRQRILVHSPLLLLTF